MARDAKIYLKFRDTGGATHNIFAYAAVGDGVADDRAAFVATEAAGDDCTAPAGIFRVASDWTLTKDWRFTGGSQVRPDNGVVVTVRGRVKNYNTDWMDTSAGGTFVFDGGERAPSMAESLGKVRSAFGANPRIHLLTDGATHQGLNAVLIDRHDGLNQQLIWRDGGAHAVDVNAVIKRAKTYGNAISPNPADTTTIYNEAGIDARNMVGMQMPAGHVLGLIVIAQRTDGTGVHKAPVMLYSFPGISEGDVWGTAIIAGVADGFWCQGHGAALLPWPASVGGHDLNGVMVFGYRMADAGLGFTNAIVALRKTSWGSLTALWTNFVAIEAPVGKTITEPQVVRLGASNRWMMFVRVQNALENILCATSTNMVNWTGWSDTGLPNGGNPISAIYRDGRIWIHGCQRTGSPQIPNGAPTTLIETYADAEELWDSSGVDGWSGWRVLCRAPHRLIGDLNYWDFNGDLTAVLCVAESGDTLTAKVAVLSSIY